MNTRPAAVAGLFYPDDARALGQSVDHLLAAAESRDLIPKAIVAPHAGYIYSGPIAASAYRCLDNLSDTITRVILLGPAHRVGFQGIAACTADQFETPLGTMSIDMATVQSAVNAGLAHLYDRAHEQEHSIEVHLPFIQRMLGKVDLVPLLVGRETPVRVAELLTLLWGGPETFIIISSDLSHYLNYTSAQAIDAETSNAIQQLDGDSLTFEHACGCLPVQGMLKAARDKGLRCSVLDTRNSGDTAGPKDRVVGYGAYAFHA